MCLICVIGNTFAILYYIIFVTDLYMYNKMCIGKAFDATTITVV